MNYLLCLLCFLISRLQLLIHSFLPLQYSLQIRSSRQVGPILGRLGLLCCLCCCPSSLLSLGTQEKKMTFNLATIKNYIQPNPNQVVKLNTYCTPFLHVHVLPSFLNYTPPPPPPIIVSVWYMGDTNWLI